MSKAETLRTFVAEISKVLESFHEKDSRGKQALNELAASDPPVFFAAGIRVVATSKPSEGLRYLILTLSKDKRLSIGLQDSNVCTLQEALAVTRAAAEAGAQLQATFEMALNKALQGQASTEKSQRISRILDMLAITCDQNCWNSFQVELMAYPDKVVRAKAALLIGRSTRNVGWIARRLLDRDTRVQASAVEALWRLDPEEARPHLLAALKSSNNRVAGNAALGLYVIGDVTAARVLMQMLRHDDPAFRLSALWAIGETQDERFRPPLAEFYKHAEGKARLAAVGAMSRIRRREKLLQNAGALQIHLSQAITQPDGRRRVVFALSCHPARDLSDIKPTAFVVRENGTLVEDYQVRLAGPPSYLIAGFIPPWGPSADEPYENAVREGLKQCLAMKRRDDLWRVDRYSLESNPQTGENSPQDSLIPYDDSLATPELKAALGWMSDAELLAKALVLQVPLNRAASDPITALQRQCETFAKRGSKRHVFLFLHEMPGSGLQQEEGLKRLLGMVQDHSVILHALCPDNAGRWPGLRDICLSNPEGSFTETTLDGMVDGLVDVYSTTCSRFEITFSAPAGSSQPEPGATVASKVTLRISSPRGCAQTEISLEPPAPPAPTTPEPAAPSQPAAPEVAAQPA